MVGNPQLIRVKGHLVGRQRHLALAARLLVSLRDISSVGLLHRAQRPLDDSSRGHILGVHARRGLQGACINLRRPVVVVKLLDRVYAIHLAARAVEGAEGLGHAQLAHVVRT